MAEQLYDAIYQWRRVGKITITSLSLPFFQQLRPSAKVGTFNKEGSDFERLVTDVLAYADDFSLINQEYLPKDGSMSEVSCPQPAMPHPEHILSKLTGIHPG